MNAREKELERKKCIEYADNYDLYMMKCVLPEVYSSQIASYYYRELSDNISLKQCIGTIGEVFNVKFDFDSIRKEVEEILRIKYNLEIVKDNPLTIKCLG